MHQARRDVNHKLEALGVERLGDLRRKEQKVNEEEVEVIRKITARYDHDDWPDFDDPVIGEDLGALFDVVRAIISAHPEISDEELIALVGWSTDVARGVRAAMTMDDARKIVAKLLAILTKDNPYPDDGKFPINDERKAAMAGYVIRSSNDGFKFTDKNIKRLATGKIPFGEYAYDGWDELYAECFEIATGS
jgi:hypothetical protein